MCKFPVWSIHWTSPIVIRGKYFRWIAYSIVFRALPLRTQRHKIHHQNCHSLSIVDHCTGEASKPLAKPKLANIIQRFINCDKFDIHFFETLISVIKHQVLVLIHTKEVNFVFMRNFPLHTKVKYWAGLVPSHSTNFWCKFLVALTKTIVFKYNSGWLNNPPILLIISINTTTWN